MYHFTFFFGQVFVKKHWGSLGSSLGPLDRPKRVSSFLGLSWVWFVCQKKVKFFLPKILAENYLGSVVGLFLVRFRCSRGPFKAGFGCSRGPLKARFGCSRGLLKGRNLLDGS